MPDERGGFGYAFLPYVFPVVLDAMALRDQLLRIARTGQRTVLVTAANSGVLRLFCARHVMEEVEEHQAEWATQKGVSVPLVHAVWLDTLAPLLRCVEVPTGLAVAGEQRRLDALDVRGSKLGDPDDVPTATLALLLGAPLLSRDHKPLIAVYGADIDHVALGRWLPRLYDGGDVGATGSFLQSVELLGSVLGRGVFVGLRELAGRVPWPWLLLGGVAAGAAVHVFVPSATQRKVGSVLGDGLLSAVGLVAEMARLRAEAETRFEALLPDQPSWNQIRNELGAAAGLTRACLYQLARSPRSDQSAVELSALLGEVGVRPRGPAVVRAALRRQACFDEPYPGRFQVGHPWYTR
ncbi:MAG: hypothetical protein J0I40_09470 [Cellulomonas sp.]|nr:hypothetical protein [Cellulomonas sp.]